jgi:hypothetical protein
MTHEKLRISHQPPVGGPYPRGVGIAHFAQWRCRDIVIASFRQAFLL